MKGNERKALHGKNVEELKSAKDILYREIRTLRLEKTDKKGKNVRISRSKKDDLARILTILKEKEQKL